MRLLNGTGGATSTNRISSAATGASGVGGVTSAKSLQSRVRVASGGANADARVHGRVASAAPSPAGRNAGNHSTPRPARPAAHRSSAPTSSPAPPAPAAPVVHSTPRSQQDKFYELMRNPSAGSLNLVKHLVKADDRQHTSTDLASKPSTDDAAADVKRKPLTASDLMRQESAKRCRVILLIIYI